MTPLVAVVADVREDAGYTWHAAAQTYLDALVGVSGVTPLVVPSLNAIDLDGLLARVDGVVSTGARSNVHPSRYGEEETEEHAPFDPRPRWRQPRVDARRGEGKGLPLLALCRGFQEMNVAWGGTLTPALHTVPGRIDHRAPESPVQDERFAMAHEVTPVEGGRLAAILGTDPVRVNSLHRQGVVRLGDGLSIEAAAPDGTIEAISVTNAFAFALGFQWHPEYWARSDPPSRAVFEAFGAALRNRAEGKWLAQARLERDVDAGERLGDRAAGLGLVGDAVELVGRDAGHGEPASLSFDVVMAKPPPWLLDADFGRGLELVGRMARLGQHVGQLHGEAAGMGGGDELLRIGARAAALVLEAALEAVGRLIERAALRRGRCPCRR